MKKINKNSILIVDDESSNIEALSHILSPEYTVYVAQSGLEAIKAAEEYLPDVILLDILMPEVDGYEVLSALKKSEGAKEIPVIFVTGLASADDEAKGLALGAADYISKPFSSAIVKLRVENQIKILKHSVSEYDVMKYKLMSDALHVALWDLIVVQGDPVNLNNKITYSQEFRFALGFSDEDDFPNIIQSWSERLHPEDKERSINALAAHILDRTGRTPFDIEYRLKIKNGEYRHFHALGTTLRDNTGIPLRVAGALMDIHEQKQMAEALEKSSLESKRTLDNMTSVLNNANALIYATDLETYEILFITDYMKRHLGIEGDVIGKPCYKIFQSDEDGRCDFCPRHKLDKEPDKAVVWEERNAVTNRYYRKTDRYIDWPDGRKVHIQYAVDLTDIKQMEREISEANERTKLMLDSSPLSCEIWDRDLNSIDCNEAAIRLFGCNDKQEFLRRYTEFFPEYQPDGQKSLKKGRECIEKAFEEGFYALDFTYQMPDGTLMPAHVTFIRVKYGADYAVVAYTRDLREHNRLMSEVNRHTSELALQKNTLQTLIDSIPDLVFSKDMNFNYTLLNTSAADYLGVDIDNVIGKGDLDGLKFSAEVAEIMISADKKVFGGQKKVITEDLIPSYDGSVRAFETTKAPIIQDGTVVGLVGASRDITEKKQMEKKLKAALEAATAASRAKSDFLSTMSHEIRTPMNAVIGMAAIGKRAKDLEEKNHALNKIGDASSHLLGVINDILDMAKIEANKLELAPVEYNFERMLQKVLTIVNFRAGEKEQTLSVVVDDSIPHFIIGDEQRLAQVITNVMSNAVKFTPVGGAIHFEASLVEEIDGNCELRITVTDSGIGMSPEQQERMFRAFEQAESGISREYGGTGLGLVISKRIVELMDGEIRVESELGKGAKFTFTVKARRGVKDSRSLLAPGVNWKNVRILVVDDMIEIRNQFQSIFSQLDVNCDVACDGLDACRIIEERGGYDVYFVDWRMPGMDGIELTRQIKSRNDGKLSVVIMITAMDWEQVKGEALAVGVDKYLLKPLFSSAVIDCINECFGTACVQTEGAEHIGGQFAGKRMLLAEDMEVNREILVTLLQDTGLIIDCAENGQEALDMVQANPGKYDIVFMDVQMPKMNGLEATRRIRALPSLGDVELPIVAMTAHVFKSDIEECIAAGMNDHLGKPCDIDKVIEILRKYLGIQTAVTQLTQESAKGKLSGNKAHSPINPGVAKIFLRDASKSITVLEGLNEKNGIYDDEDIRAYIIHVHGMKSVLANIGKKELSDVAFRLEMLGRNKDIEAASSELPMFIGSLRALIDEFTQIKEEAGGELGDVTYLREKLLELSAICEVYDANSAEDILAQLREQTWAQPVKDFLESISEFLLHSDFDEIVEAVNKFSENLE